MAIALDVFLCLLNLFLAFLNYRQKNYEWALLSAFASGFCIAVAITLFIINYT